MIDHVTINVSNFEKSKDFYLKALKPLGYGLIREFAEWRVAGFGAGGKPDLWIHTQTDALPQGIHIAFAAEDKKIVEEFYKAALSAGGKDNGKPEYQKDYGPGYFGAFVFDPDGHNIEAVFRDPSPTK